MIFAHFRVTRDVITKLGYYKPAIMHSIFLSGLQQGGSGKMSASDPGSALYNCTSFDLQLGITGFGLILFCFQVLSYWTLLL